MTHTRMRRAIGVTAAGIMLGVSGCGPRPLMVVSHSADDAWVRGDLSLAEAEYLEILERRPEEWRSRLMLARIYALQDRWEEAERQIDIAYTFAGTDPDVLDLFAEAKLKTGRVEELERELRNAATVTGRWEDWLRLGNALVEMGDLDGAAPALETAARLDKGEHVTPQLALARLRAAAGDEEAALRRYRMVLFLDPSSAEARRAIREAGEIPGPTLALPPAERDPRADLEEKPINPPGRLRR